MDVNIVFKTNNCRFDLKSAVLHSNITKHLNYDSMVFFKSTQNNDVLIVRSAISIIT